MRLSFGIFAIILLLLFVGECLSFPLLSRSRRRFEKAGLPPPPRTFFNCIQNTKSAFLAQPRATNLSTKRTVTSSSQAFQKRSSHVVPVLILHIILALTTTTLYPSPSLALKEKNEALCGTGFFTNIAQYKCTEIGDISNDGQAQPLSVQELNSVDSLMGKLSMADTTTSITTTTTSSNAMETTQTRSINEAQKTN